MSPQILHTERYVYFFKPKIDEIVLNSIGSSGPICRIRTNEYNVEVILDMSAGIGVINQISVDKICSVTGIPIAPITTNVILKVAMHDGDGNGSG